MRSPRFELKQHLKFDDSHRIIHIGDWEAEGFIQTVLGVRHQTVTFSIHKFGNRLKSWQNLTG